MEKTNKYRDILVRVENGEIIMTQSYRFKWGDPVDADVDFILSKRGATVLAMKLLNALLECIKQDEALDEKGQTNINRPVN
jgi:hypothetical protein